MDLATSLGKWIDPEVYGIDWEADDDNPDKKPPQKIRQKPFCEFEGCAMRVSTEHGRPKPFCRDHVFENPYVKALLKRIENLDDKADRKRTKEAFERAKAQYEVHES